MISRKYLILGLILLVAFLFLPEAFGQCPMCRLSAEQNLKDGGSAGTGLNRGILFLLSIPYVIIGAIGYSWYRSHYKSEKG